MLPIPQGRLRRMVIIAAGWLVCAGAAAQSINLPVQLEANSQVPVTFSVSRSGATNVTIPLSSNSSALVVPKSIVLLARNTSVKFTVQTGAVVSNARATLTAGQISMQTTVLAPPRVMSLALAPTAVTAGTSSTATVALSRAAVAGGVRVALSSSNATAVAVPATLTIASGSSGGTFVVQTNSALNQQAVVGIKSQVASTPEVAANLTVNPLPVAVASVAIPAVVTQGMQGTGQVRLNRVVSTATTVTIQKFFQNLVVPATVNVPAGSDQANFAVSASGLSEAFSFGPTTITARVTSPTVSSNQFTVNGPPSTLQSITVTADYPAGVAQTFQNNIPSVVAGYKARATIRLNTPAPAGGKTFQIRSIQPAPCVTSDVSSVTVPAGTTETSFTFTTVKWFSTGTAIPSCTGNFVADMFDGPDTSIIFAVVWPMVTGFTVSPTLVQAGENVTLSATISAPAPPPGLPPALFCRRLVPGTAATDCGIQFPIPIPTGATSGSSTPSPLTLANNQTPPTTQFFWVASTMTDDPTRGVGGSVEIAHLRPREIRFFNAAGTAIGIVQGGDTVTVRVDFGRTAITPVTVGIAGHVSFSTCNDSNFSVVPSWFPSTVTVAAGQQFATFTIQTQGFSCPAQVLVTSALNLATGFQTSGTLTVNP